MKKRVVFFLIGVLLFITSLPLSTKMVMELIHNQKMDARYTITDINTGYPPVDSSFEFHGHRVEIQEIVKNEEQYIDPWDNKIALADLSLNLDGVQVDTLKSHPVRVEESGLNRYYGEIAYLMVEDNNMNKTELSILLKKTRELQKEKPNGDIEGWVPEEELKYTLYRLKEEGDLKSESFSFTERNTLQTELLNAGGASPYAVGYYTDAWKSYPIFCFPWIFPFLTLLVGFVLMIISFLFRKMNKN